MFRCLRVFSAGTLASFHIPKTSQTRQSNTWNCPECEWMAVLSRVLCDWLATSQKSEMTDSCSNGALMRANAIKMQIWCFVTSVVYLLFHQSFASEFNLQIVSKNLKVTPHWSAKLLCKGNFIYFTHWMNWTNRAKTQWKCFHFNPIAFLFASQRSCYSCCGVCTCATPSERFTQLFTSHATWRWPSTTSYSYRPSSTSSGGCGKREGSALKSGSDLFGAIPRVTRSC